MERQEELQESANEILPLCVDLDGTLVKTDTLIECLSIIFKTQPWHLFSAMLWLTKGKAYFKARVAAVANLNPVTLPYNKELFFYLKRMHRRGQPLFLVTGAHQSIADGVANYLGVFSGVIASNELNNNTGDNKAAVLKEKFGEGKFDYVGNSSVDLPVWQFANQALIVTHSMELVKRTKAVARVTKIFRNQRKPVKLFLKAIRIHQWVKNLLILVPLFLGLGSNFQNNLTLGVLAFFAFSLLASAIYMINDIYDLESDRQHPDKCHRPFASGDLSASVGLVAIPVLMTCSLVCSMLTENLEFLFVLGVYVGTTTAYTFKLKKIPIVDIMLLTALYSLRLWAGRVVTDTALSPWLLAFSGFFFLSLALIKRTSELLKVRDSGGATAQGRGYHVEDIPLLISLGVASGYGAVVVMTLYINSPQARLQYEYSQLLWLTCPILTFWFTRIWFLANRRRVDSDPVRFALTDPVSVGVAIGIGIVWFFAKGLGSTLF